MRLSLPLTMVLAGAAAVAPVDARRYPSSLLASVPRRQGRNYLYNRRSPATSNNVDVFDLAMDIFQSPMYATANSLFRQSAEAALPDHLASSFGAGVSSPRYAISENREAGTLELTMEVPGVEAEDLIIEVEDNKFLRIQGSRTFTSGDSAGQVSSKSEFDQTFQLDNEIDPSSLTVTLSSGILKVTGQKKDKLVKRLEITTADKHQQAEAIPVKEKQSDGNPSIITTETATTTTAKNDGEQDDPDELIITEEDAWVSTFIGK